MNQKTPIDEIVKSFGLTLERLTIPENEGAIQIYKGAKQIFSGTEDAARDFLVHYEKKRPDLYAGSMYGYKE